MSSGNRLELLGFCKQRGQVRGTAKLAGVTLARTSRRLQQPCQAGLIVTRQGSRVMTKMIAWMGRTWDTLEPGPRA